MPIFPPQFAEDAECAVNGNPAPLLDQAPYSSLAAWFDATAVRFAERTALTLGDRHMTYAELWEAAERVAGALRRRGIGRGSAPVAILMERSFEMVVAMLGVIRVGAAYLPLDPRYPEARLQATVLDARPAAVLMTRGAERVLEGTECLVLEDLLGTCMAAAADELLPSDLAYVIYTSGSTGQPKGVRVTHANVCELMRGTSSLFGFDEHDVWTMFHSFAFDFSVWEMWGALLHGGRLVLVPYATSRAPDAFRQLLASERVTVLNQTPSAFTLLDQADEAAAEPLSLRVIIFGGEALPPRLLQGWFGRHGDEAPRLINMYGITETTVHATYRRMRLPDADDPDSLLGEPFAGVTLALLDDGLQPVAPGEPGEICVGGTGVAAGYLHRPELTRERFVSTAGGRLYRSGDMARRRADSELVSLGRRDGQVKIAGFRIELGEVEAALAAHPALAQACVLAEPGPDGAPRLAAYFVARTQAIFSGTELNGFLAERLPAHMLPRVYRQLAAFPLNANGKIDRSALAQAETISAGSDRRSEAPGDAYTARVRGKWGAVLGLAPEALSDNANFFDVGGTSLLLVRLKAGLELEFAQTIAVSTMFAATTISAMAALLREGARDAGPARPPAASSGSMIRRAQERAAQQRQALAKARERRGNL